MICCHTLYSLHKAGFCISLSVMGGVGGGRELYSASDSSSPPAFVSAAAAAATSIISLILSTLASTAGSLCAPWSMHCTPRKHIEPIHAVKLATSIILSHVNGRKGALSSHAGNTVLRRAYTRALICRALFSDLPSILPRSSASPASPPLAQSSPTSSLSSC